MVNFSKRRYWIVSLILQYFPSRPFVESIFYSRIVHNPSDFNLFNSLGGGICNGGTGAKGGAGAGTTAAVGGVAARALDKSGRDLARISVCRDYRGKSSSGSDNATWELKDSPWLPELFSGTSDMGLLPVPYPPFGVSSLSFLGGLAPPLFINTLRALLRDSMLRLVLAISRVRFISRKVLDRLVEPIDESSNCFCEPTRACRKGLGVQKGRSRKTIGESLSALGELQLLAES
uniref:Uncharacterized protein n=1 Tax=Solanum tuberosum TaxID=4113 RepID=M1DMP6_SOLTU